MPLGLGLKQGVSAFTPLNVGVSCVLWCRGDLGITLNGSNVSAWADQSGANNSLSQATGAAQPPYSSSSAHFNSQPIVTFAGGSSSFLQHNSFALGTGGSMFMYMVHRVLAAANSVLAAYSTTFIYDDASGTSLTVVAGGLTKGWGSTTLNSSVAAYSYFTSNGASSAVGINVSAGTEQTTTGTGTALLNSQNLVIGAYSGGTIGTNYELAEIVIYTSKPVAGDLANLYAYFRGRYGSV